MKISYSTQLLELRPSLKNFIIKLLKNIEDVLDSKYGIRAISEKEKCASVFTVEFVE